jgi:hypothetical protein
VQAQLRGLIGDYNDNNEEVLAGGLDAFDTLNRCLEEYEASKATATGGKESGLAAVMLAPPPGHLPPPSVVSPPIEDERPLIEL